MSKQDNKLTDEFFDDRLSWRAKRDLENGAWSSEATAHHEAGHAVIAQVLGLRDIVITTGETNDFLGRCWFTSAPHELRSYLLAMLAGGFADAKYRGVDWDCFIHDAEPSKCDEWDLACFKSGVIRYARLNGLSAQRSEARIFQECETLVEQHWQEIQRIARGDG